MATFFKCAFVVIFLFISLAATRRIDSSRKKFQHSTTTSGDLQAPKSTINKKTITYIRALIPIRIFQCMEKSNILRCMKLFLLQRTEGVANFSNSGNLTRDFLEQILADERNYPSLLDKKYAKINESELNDRLMDSFQRFFKDRDIKLHFTPGILVKIVPSRENTIKVSLKKSRSNARGSHKTYKYMMQIGVPMLMMPAVLMGSFLPFMLPAMKMATLMTMLINKGVLMAAVLYAARTAALNNDAEAIHYSHPGYH